MTPDEYLQRYERALASQRWDQVDPLVHDDVCVTFSTGAVHRGKQAVQKAFEGNFASIQNEHYEMLNIHWLKRGSDVAIYLFDFKWSGIIGGQPAQGSGRGTSVLVRDGEVWKLLVEHLGPGSSK